MPPDGLLDSVSNFAFGRGALTKAAGTGGASDPGPDPGPVDSAALLKRNQEFTDRQKDAADKARAKAIVAPKTNPAKSAVGRKRY